MTNMAKAIAVFNDRVKGTVTFVQKDITGPVWVKFDLKQLPKNKKMAIHIHEFGDLSNGCKSLGGHWNPFNKQHGSVWVDIINSHAGDMINNLISDYRGRFVYEYVDHRICLKGSVENTIIGRSVVIHKGVDDLGLGRNKNTKITGNAGERLDCAVIGITKK